MTTPISPYSRNITQEEQQLYDHLLHIVEVESPGRMIERFRTLFVEGVGYPERPIAAALDQVTASRFAEQEFRFVLNRCCHILINRWQVRPQLQAAIPELLAIFEEAPSRPVTEFSRQRAVRRLRSLVGLFVQSEQYATLRRLGQVLGQSPYGTGGIDHRPLGTLIRRYPYLYGHCLISEDSSFEHQESVRQIQSQVQQQFEVDLSQYVTYQVRRSQIARLSPQSSAAQNLRPIKNPTLLDDRDLYLSLKHFLGKVEGTGTYWDSAHRFLAHINHAPSFSTFKDDLYEYITASVDPAYGKRRFNDQLYTQLRNTLPHNDSHKVNELLMIRTCSQLMNFLVVDSPQQPQHFTFIDLMTNIGPNATTGLMLKLVLICKKVRPYLEKRFSILFNHYELYSRNSVQWLIQALETVNLALSTHFGTVDLSLLQKCF